MIETLVVDLGGVAARFRPERRLGALASLSDVALKVVQERLFDSGFEQRAEMGEYSVDQVKAVIRDALEYDGAFEAVVEAWALAFEPDREVLTFLDGVPLPKVLFTNNGPMLGECLAGPLRDVATPFTDVVCSWQLKARKPDAATFERAAARLGLSPDRLLLLDDSTANVEAAISSGWQADCVAGPADIVAAIERRCLRQSQ